jgi:Zn-finger nucleic acid-binding protein
MAEARVYQCPVCGAFARDRERTCRHCSTLLATLRCGHCFELNFPDDLHCRGCGLELGLAPDPDAEGSAQDCPDCKRPLQAFKAGPGELYACERCGGQMVTHGLLRALVEQRAVLGRAVPSPGEAPRGNPLTDPVHYRACPSCSQLMNRKNFGGVSGIIVDVCTLHGTYFDAGELPRVLEFVRRGGLAKAHAALQTAAARPAAGGLLEPLPDAGSTGMLDELVDLVSFVVDVLRHH